MGVCLRSPIYIFIFTIIWQKKYNWCDFPISVYIDPALQSKNLNVEELNGRMGMAGDRPSSKILPVASSCLLVALSLIFLPPALAHLPQERDYSLVVDAGKEECFFEEVVKGNTLTVEYQVHPARTGPDLSSINMFSSLSGVRWRGWDDVRAGHQLQVALPSRSSACCRVQEVRRDA